MANFSFKKNDVVVVRSGKDRGKTGKVLKVLREENKVVVEKVNFVKIFVRPDRSQNIQGGIMEKKLPCLFPGLCYIARIADAELEPNIRF